MQRHRLEIRLAVHRRKRMLRVGVMAGKFGRRQRVRSFCPLVVAPIIEGPVRMRSPLLLRRRLGLGNVSKWIRISCLRALSRGGVSRRVQGVMSEGIVIRKRIGFRL